MSFSYFVFVTIFFRVWTDTTKLHVHDADGQQLSGSQDVTWCDDWTVPEKYLVSMSDSQLFQKNMFLSLCYVSFALSFMVHNTLVDVYQFYDTCSSDNSPFCNVSKFNL